MSDPTKCMDLMELPELPYFIVGCFPIQNILMAFHVLKVLKFLSLTFKTLRNLDQSYLPDNPMTILDNFNQSRLFLPTSIALTLQYQSV